MMRDNLFWLGKILHSRVALWSTETTSYNMSSADIVALKASHLPIGEGFTVS